MVQLKANDLVTAFLGPIKERTEVLDGRGKVLGYFTPAESTTEILRRKARDDHESGAYQERKAMSEGQERSTTEQVLERLRSLESA